MFLLKYVTYKSLLFTLPFCISISMNAQIFIKGKTNESANIQIIELKKGTQANEAGDYTLEIPKTGSFTVLITAVGFKAYREKFTIKKGETKILNILLKPTTNELNEVQVSAKSNAQAQREEPIKVEVLEISKVAERAISLPQIINQTAGVKIRESSGVGSNFEVNINGLQGNAIRFFRNGILTDYLGRANQLNLIPSGLISNVEIYKGILPIDLGADALGGGINITTKAPNQKYLTTSYETGSFNTHIGTVNANYNFPKSKFHIGTSSYIIYSDNNYPFDAPVRDPQTQQLQRLRLRRFHDKISSQFVQANFGVHQTKFADLLNFEIAYFSYKKDLQNGFQIEEVFGEASATEKSNIYSLTYEKNIKDKFLIKAFGAFSKRNEKLKDVSNNNYDWYGKITNPDQPQMVSGEISSPKTDQSVDNNIFIGRLYAQYSLNNQLTFKLSSMISDQNRVGSDPYSTPNPVTNIQPITIPNYYQKIISGFASSLQLFDNKLHNEFTAKHFYIHTYTTNLWRVSETIEQIHHSFGVGNSIKYAIDNSRYLRLSVEKTTRIPEASEYFGDNLFLLPNPRLKPETSKNVNIGYVTPLNKKQSLFIDLNLFYRNTENFIRTVPLGFIFAINENTNAQLTKGVESTLRFKSKHGIKANLAITYQDMRRRKSGNALEGSRTPNTPYFFTNLNASKEIIGAFKLPLDLEFYASHFFTEQYLLFPITKNLEPSIFERNLGFTDLIIPAQSQLDAGITIKFQKLPLNINTQLNNITNAKLYDQFRVQKPSRNIRVKLTYKF